MHTHERSREHTQPLGAHTSTALAAGPGEGGSRGGAAAGAWQSLPPRPCKGLRNRRRLQPAPPSPGRVQRRGNRGKGCVPCCVGSRGSGRGEALGAGPGCL